LRFRASIQIAILLTARFWGRQHATASALFAVDRYPLSEGAEEESQGHVISSYQMSSLGHAGDVCLVG
jgi:hypothetical protein